MTSSAPIAFEASPSSTRGKTLLVLALIFLCGGASGWALHESIRPAAIPPGQGPRKPFGKDEFAAHLRQRFTRELSLTEAQQSAVAPALERAAATITEARQAGEKQARAVFDALHAEIRPQLTEDQVKKLEAMPRRRRDGPPPPP